MTSQERIASVILATKHVVHHQIPGAIVECGVWRGGSTMAAALALQELGENNREIHLYDTFEGMPEATAQDVAINGEPAEQLLAREPRGTGIWCYAGLEDVQRNLRATRYPETRVHYIRGKVEETIPNHLPEAIALLRLDTDWYSSTRHELLHLYPRLQPGGIMIIDDYGHWQGARKAVDEYLEALAEPIYLHRVDYTARLLVKPWDRPRPTSTSKPEERTGGAGSQ
jgi:predicted O-methyltransferase YrrM